MSQRTAHLLQVLVAHIKPLMVYTSFCGRNLSTKRLYQSDPIKTSSYRGYYWNNENDHNDVFIAIYKHYVTEELRYPIAPYIEVCSSCMLLSADFRAIRSIEFSKQEKI